MKNNFADVFSKLDTKDTGTETLKEVKAPRYKTTRQISAYVDSDALDFVKIKSLNRTQIINDAVIEYLKANYEYKS